MKKIIIIGGGISGLSTGIYALKKSYDVTIYEKNKTVGGCCSGWVREGYYIDNCMHWLTGANHNSDLFKFWKEVGAIEENSNLYQGEYFYKSCLNKEEVSLYADLTKAEKEMISLSPSDKDEIKSFIKAVRYLSNTFKADNLFKKAIYKVKGYPYVYSKYKDLSLNDLSHHFTHPLLKKMCTDYIPGCYSSIALIYSYATFCSGDGKIYQKGSSEFSNNIRNKFLSLGGEIICDSEVSSMLIEDDNAVSITLKNGSVVNGDAFVCAIDPFFTFNNLLPKSYMPQLLADKYKQKYDYPIFSSFQAAYLVDKKELPFKDTVVFDIPKTTVGTSIISRLVLREYSYLYPDKDKTVYQILIVQNERDYRYWEELEKKDKDAYTKEKNNISKTILDHIVMMYPSLKGSISVLDSWTPKTYNTYFNSYLGSYLGFTYTKESKFTKIPSKIKGLNNVYLASIWQSICGGLPMALKNGRTAGKWL